MNKTSPLVVQGALDIRKALSAYKEVVKKHGDEPAAVAGAEQRLAAAVSAEQHHVSAYHSKEGPLGEKKVELREAQNTIAKAYTELSALNEAARRKSVPPGTQWPEIPRSWYAGDTAIELVKLAHVSGKPQAAMFNEIPVVAMPGQAIDEVMANWKAAHLKSPAEQLETGIDSLGYSIKSRQTEVKNAEEASRAPRSLEQIMAALIKESPKDWFAHGLVTLANPAEMRLFISEVLRQAPNLLPNSPDPVQEVKWQLWDYVSPDSELTNRSVRNAWKEVFEELIPSPPPQPMGRLTYDDPSEWVTTAPPEWAKSDKTHGERP